MALSLKRILFAFALSASAYAQSAATATHKGPSSPLVTACDPVENPCAPDLAYTAWPGSPTIHDAGPIGVFRENLSGLALEPGTPNVLWAVRNGPGTLYRLIPQGNQWIIDTNSGWSSGKPLRYPDGTENPDSEGVTFAGQGSRAGLYVATERRNTKNSISRNTVLRFDPATPGTTLTATNEWDLTADLPSVGPNFGLEAITWIPDRLLTARRFFDESKNRTYRPSDYPNHGDGLFFVGLEGKAAIYAYALDHKNNTFTRLATIKTGLAGVMDLAFDRDTNDLWAICDDTCQGRSVVLRIGANGRFEVARRYERPTGMPNLNNEGFTIAPASQCSNGVKPVYWADDSETNGQSLRSGTLTCSPF
jgi:hypothetical protein